MQNDEIRLLLNELQESVTRIERRVERLEALPDQVTKLRELLIGPNGGSGGIFGEVRTHDDKLTSYPPRDTWERLIAHEAATAREIGKTRGSIDRLQSNIRSGWLSIAAFILVVGFVVSMVAGS